MLLASAYDQSRFFKAADVQAEKKLRIKDVTEEEIGVGQDKQKKLVVWFDNDPRGLVLNKTNNRTLRGAATTVPVGRGKSSSCTPPPMSSGAAWFRFSECASHRPKKAKGRLLQRSRSRQRRRRTQSCSTTS